MKYKIRIITLNNGEKKYYVYAKLLGPFWEKLNYQYPLLSREAALEVIDDHYNGKVKSIEVEYITKP